MPPNQPLEQQLIEHFLNGRQEAANQLYAILTIRLEPIVYSMKVPSADVSEIIQLTLIDFFNDIIKDQPRYDRSRPLNPWIIRLVRNKVHDHFRRLKRTAQITLDATDVFDVNDPLANLIQDDEEVLNQKRLESIYEYLDNIPSRDRELFLNHFLDDDFNHKKFCKSFNSEADDKTVHNQRCRLSRIIQSTRAFFAKSEVR